MRYCMMALVLLFAGCATITGNRNFDSRYDQIQKGVSTRQEVIDLLGAPTQVVHPDEKHAVLIYEKRKIYPAHWFAFTNKIDTERLSVFINESDVVDDYKMDTMTDDYIPQGGGGGGVYNTYQPAQPNFSNSLNGGNHY